MDSKTQLQLLSNPEHMRDALRSSTIGNFIEIADRAVVDGEDVQTYYASCAGEAQLTLASEAEEELENDSDSST